MPLYRHEKRGGRGRLTERWTPDAGEFIWRIIGRLCRLSRHTTQYTHRVSTILS